MVNMATCNFTVMKSRVSLSRSEQGYTVRATRDRNQPAITDMWMSQSGGVDRLDEWVSME